MNDLVGFTNYEWKKFLTHDILYRDFADVDYFRLVLRSLCLRYKKHAAASLKSGPGRMIPLNNGHNDPVDEKFLQAVEAEFPLDKLFRDDFRGSMTTKLHASDPGEMALSRVRTQVLWDCCTRSLIKLLPAPSRAGMVVPDMPLHGLRDPNNLLRCRNHVTIEDYDPSEAPTLAVQQQQVWERPSAEMIRQASRQEQMPFLVMGDEAALDEACNGK